MKLLRRNNLNRSKTIGLVAFVFAIVLFFIFFQNGNKDKQNTSVHNDSKIESPKNPS